MVAVPPGIVVLEGADGSGKTRLANHFREKYGARYMHSRIWKDRILWDSTMMRRAERFVCDRGELVIFDRMWPSELIYGPIFRGGAAYGNDMANEFDELICAAPGVYVLCVPSDAQKHLARFERLKTERKEAFDRMEQVIQRYQDLLYGNVAHPGENLVDLFIRYGDFCNGRDVYHHDIDGPRSGVEKAAKKVMEMLR